MAWFCLPRGTGQDKKAKGKLGREGESHLLRNFRLNLTKGKSGEEGEEKNCATCPLVAPLLISTLTIHQPCSEALSQALFDAVLGFITANIFDMFMSFLLTLFSLAFPFWKTAPSLSLHLDSVPGCPASCTQIGSH